MKYKAGSRRRAAEYERALIEWWKKNKVFEKSVEQRPIDNSYVFYDGPPFITGMPHHGTLLSSIVKDAVPRFWTMRGKRVERRWGWDCHGLPAENFVEKQLGITDRREIDTDSLSERSTALKSAAAQSQDAKSSSFRCDATVSLSDERHLTKESMLSFGSDSFRCSTSSCSSSPLTSSDSLAVNGVAKKITLEDYILKARESMVANSETWEGTIDRIGRWVDFKGAYRTMDKNFMESVWWAFKTLYEAGKIYEGAKVLMYDTKFATPVSKSEVTMDNDAYQTVTDPSAYVKFKVSAPSSRISSSEPASTPSLDTKSSSVRSSVLPRTSSKMTADLESLTKGGDMYFLTWTTTPWTLVGNMALAVNPQMEYGAYDAGDGRVFIVAKSRAEAVQKLLEQEWQELATIKGEELVGLEYEPLFLSEPERKLVDWQKFEKNYYPAKAENVHKVWGAEFVSDGDGTGIVHIAPAYGEDDYELGRANGVPCIDVLDEYGCYLSGADEGLRAAGVRPNEEGQIQIWETNKFIAKCLEEAGPIEKIEYIKHEYPFNPRSKQRIMYRAFPSWFFDVQGQKGLMLEQNENINWFPGYLKEGRFKKNIEQAPDWNLSRDRFWATAMPVWKGDKGTVKVVGSYAELKELSGVELEDYHRPWVDEIEFDLPMKNKGHLTNIEIGKDSKVLFVCFANIGRSQMAKALYNRAVGRRAADSAGTDVANQEGATIALRNKKWAEKLGIESYLSSSQDVLLDDYGIDITDEPRMQVTPEMLGEYDLIVNIAEKSQTPDWLRGENVVWWNVDDPGKIVDDGAKLVAARQTSKEIERRIEELVAGKVVDDGIDEPVETEHFKRIEKVLDCWFESGSMPFAQLHYPFENKEKFERNYPADFIVEYVGQVRAWFYYVHCVNTALASVGGFGEAAQKRGEKNAFKNVITTGTLAGNDGRKMSKSLGNYTDPNVLMDQYSADALRFLLLSSPVLSGEDFALTDKDVSDVNRKLAMIWNVYDFFTTYAEVDNWEGPDSFSERTTASKSSSTQSQDQESSSFRASDSPCISSQVTSSDELEVGALRDLENPLDRWILARLYELKAEVIEGMEEYNIPKALSDVLPFVDDLSNWFVRRSRRRFWKSEDDGDKKEAYWTLYTVLERLARILAPFTPFLAEELYQNLTGSGESVHLTDFPQTTEIDDQEILGQMARVREVINEGLRLRMYKDEQEEQVKVRQPLAKLVYAGAALPDWGEEIVKEEVNVKAVECGERTWIDKKLTDELKQEGFVRELIRSVQSARKKAGLVVDDRIRLSVNADVPEEWKETLMNEVLAKELSRGENYAYDEIVKVNGENVTISLEKVE